VLSKGRGVVAYIGSKACVKFCFDGVIGVGRREEILGQNGLIERGRDASTATTKRTLEREKTTFMLWKMRLEEILSPSHR